MTNDLGHLSISSKYTDRGKIHMGNGTGLPISHIGHNSFVSNSQVLHQKIFFMFPQLLRISFLFLNFVLIITFSLHFIPPLGITKRVLLEGAVDEGLYKFNSSKTMP